MKKIYIFNILNMEIKCFNCKKLKLIAWLPWYLMTFKKYKRTYKKTHENTNF